MALGAAPQAQQRAQVPPGSRQLFSLSLNLQGQCVFPKGNWSRNGAGRRSCLGEIVNKSPDKQKSSFYCSSGNQSLGSRKHLFFFLEEQLHLVVPLMSCVLKPLIEPFPSGLDLP